MWQEFKKFAVRGNVLDLAVGLIIGVAFGKIVASLVEDIIMPPIGLLLGKVDFSNLYVNLSRNTYGSLAAAKAAGAPTINYGQFISQLLNFLIIAFVIFLLVREFNRLKRQMASEAAASPTTRECPYCASAISVKASRCPHCTSQVAAPAGA